MAGTMIKRTYWVHILTNHSGTLYIGMTSNLAARIEQTVLGWLPLSRLATKWTA